ncbi:MAG: sensor histidine kinase, partial [Saprospiraceae bacterium]
MKLRFATCVIFLFILSAILLYVTWPWKTAALLILASAVLTIMVWVIHRRQQKAIERLRRRIARDLHDDLGASLCNICLLSALVDREIPGDEHAISHQYLNKIIAEATKVHDSIGDTIAVLSASYENLGDLAALLNRHAYELFRFQKIDFELIIPDQVKLIEISSIHRHDFYLTLKEALHNALRHAHATSV